MFSVCTCTIAEEDKFSTIGSDDRGIIYDINIKVVTKEEWTQFHRKFVNQWKDEENNEEEKTEEGMSNRHESDEEEAMGENHHHEYHSLPEGTVATLQFPIQQLEGTAPMKNISPSLLPHFH